MSATEITLTYLKDFRRCGETWAVIECAHPVSGRLYAEDYVRVRVTATADELEPGHEYRFFGQWRDNDYGRTFHASSFVPALPIGRDGIVRCLTAATGIGETLAARIYLAFGSESIHQLIDDPDSVAAAVPKLNVYVAREAGDYLRGQRGTIAAQAELLDLLGGKGFPRTIISAVIKKYGNRGPTLIRRNPFLLSQFSGAGFKRCDDLWLSLGLNPKRLKRQTLCLAYALNQSRGGDTWHTPDACKRILNETLSGATPQPVKAVRLGVRAGLFAVRRDEDRRLWITLARHAGDEESIAFAVQMSRQEEPRWPDVRGHEFSGLTEHQRMELEQALTGTICALIGSPGVGKTHTAGVLLQAIVRKYGSERVALVAPTGKAARRLTELSRQAGVSLTATTIHSYLGPMGVTDDVWKFAYNQDDQLTDRFIVVDEVSMLDAQIAAALLKACPLGTHILFVGDPDQLPSVAPGRVLSDLIEAGLPHGRLTKILRNSGRIVEACHYIRNDEPFSTDQKLSPNTGHNLKHIPSHCLEKSVREVAQLATKLRDRRLADAESFQVISATNRTRDALNIALRRVFNPAAAGTTSKYAPGDKIINTKNLRRPSVHSGEAYVCNGEQGVISAVFDNKMHAVFSDPYREVVVFQDEHIDLAYAITGHKSQGSEWPYIAVVLEGSYGARMCTDRGWLYTALSRAKRACWLIGPRNEADDMCRRISRRKTFLREEVLADGGSGVEDDSSQIVQLTIR